jgi:hypothetical protein
MNQRTLTIYTCIATLEAKNEKSNLAHVKVMNYARPVIKMNTQTLRDLSFHILSLVWNLRNFCCHCAALDH